MVDDIDLFRMQSDEDGDQSQQVTTVTAHSKESHQYSLNYEYRSRDEVANAILKLRGRDKQAEYVRAQAQHAKLQLNPRRDVKIRKEARKPAVIADAVTQSHSLRSGTVVSEQAKHSQNDMSVARSFVSMSLDPRRDVKTISEEAREPAAIADAVTQSHSSRSGTVSGQEYSTKPSQNNMSSATRSFVSMSLASRAATSVEPREQVVSRDAQRRSMQIEPKTQPTDTVTGSKKAKKTDGILVSNKSFDHSTLQTVELANLIFLFQFSFASQKSLFRCGMCATETELPDFSAVPDFAAVNEVKDYSAEGIANHVQELKIETSSHFLSPPPPRSSYIHVAPCDVVQHSESIGGCSTITHSVAGKIVVRYDAEDVPDNAATTKHSNLSACTSSLMDKDNEICDDMDEQMVSKIPSVQVPSHGQMSEADYESLGLGSQGTFASASKSASLSFMSGVVVKGSSMGLSSASELGTRTQSQSFSRMSSQDQDGNTFSSASEGASEEDSDYTLTDGSSSSPSTIDDSFTLSSYASTMQEDDSMTYGTSLSSSSSSGSYYE